MEIYYRNITIRSPVTLNSCLRKVKVHRVENWHHFLLVHKVQHVDEILPSLHRGPVQFHVLDKERGRVNAAPTTAQVSVKRDARIVGARELQTSKCGAANAVNDNVEPVLRSQIMSESD